MNMRLILRYNYYSVMLVLIISFITGCGPGGCDLVSIENVGPGDQVTQREQARKVFALAKDLVDNKAEIADLKAEFRKLDKKEGIPALSDLRDSSGNFVEILATAKADQDITNLVVDGFVKFLPDQNEKDKQVSDRAFKNLAAGTRPADEDRDERNQFLKKLIQVNNNNLDRKFLKNTLLLEAYDEDRFDQAILELKDYDIGKDELVKEDFDLDRGEVGTLLYVYAKTIESLRDPVTHEEARKKFIKAPKAMRKIILGDYKNYALTKVLPKFYTGPGSPTDITATEADAKLLLTIDVDDLTLTQAMLFKIIDMAADKIILEDAVNADEYSDQKGILRGAILRRVEKTKITDLGGAASNLAKNIGSAVANPLSALGQISSAIYGAVAGDGGEDRSVDVSSGMSGRLEVKVGDQNNSTYKKAKAFLKSNVELVNNILSRDEISAFVSRFRTDHDIGSDKDWATLCDINIKNQNFSVAYLVAHLMVNSKRQIPWAKAALGVKLSNAELYDKLMLDLEERDKAVAVKSFLTKLFANKSPGYISHLAQMMFDLMFFAKTFQGYSEEPFNGVWKFIKQAQYQDDFRRGYNDLCDVKEIKAGGNALTAGAIIIAIAGAVPSGGVTLAALPLIASAAVTSGGSAVAVSKKACDLAKKDWQDAVKKMYSNAGEPENFNRDRVQLGLGD